jgi:KaiC/GvpD/RAD55 family RecA-like ATPase
VLIVSPPYLERDLLLGKIVETTLSAGGLVIYVTRYLAKIQELAARFRGGFYVISPQADKLSPPKENVIKMPDLENLNDVNISIAEIVQNLPKNSVDRMVIVDLLSEVLVEHKELTTRNWLDEFLTKRKMEGFTILGVLNPTISSDQGIYTVMDLFGGIMEIYEKGVGEDAHRFLVVTKMYGRKYVEGELVLSKDKLF